MATISGQLTAEELQVIIADNASYRSQQSVAMADALIDAIEALLAIPLSEVDHSGERIRIDVRVLQEQQQKAVKWREAKRFTLMPPTHYIPARNWRDC